MYRYMYDVHLVRVISYCINDIFFLQLSVQIIYLNSNIMKQIRFFPQVRYIITNIQVEDLSYCTDLISVIIKVSSIKQLTMKIYLKFKCLYYFNKNNFQATR